MISEREAESRLLAARLLREAATALEEDRMDDAERLINRVPIVLMDGIADQIQTLLNKTQSLEE